MKFNLNFFEAWDNLNIQYNYPWYNLTEAKKYNGPFENIAGIYLIVNNITNQLYVGESINIGRRMADHKYADTENDCKKLHYAIKKFGADKFSFTILETFPADKFEDILKTIEWLNTNEILWISKLDAYKDTANYNLDAGGKSTFHDIKYFDDDIKKIQYELKNTDKPVSQIAKENNASSWAVWNINQGLDRFSSIKLEPDLVFPIREIGGWKSAQAAWTKRINSRGGYYYIYSLLDDYDEKLIKITDLEYIVGETVKENLRKNLVQKNIFNNIQEAENNKFNNKYYFLYQPTNKIKNNLKLKDMYIARVYLSHEDKDWWLQQYKKEKENQ